jgi:hypothetical protein
MRHVLSTSSQKPSSQKLTAWLRDRTSSLDYGVEYRPEGKKPHPIHCNKQTALVDLLSKTVKKINRLSNDDLDRHWTGQAKYYFTAQSDPKKPQTLCCLDADAHDYGTVDGCIRHLKVLAERLGLDALIEASERGAHAYFILDKCGEEAGHVNLVLKMLADEVKRELPSDVQQVEVKGTCLEITWGTGPMSYWGTGGRPVQRIKMGSLCTIPRNKATLDVWRLKTKPTNLRAYPRTLAVRKATMVN